tara:strand:- start:108 stop:1730 length:1623 start_codon:yes stop_codon:yes gene_type:complete
MLNRSKGPAMWSPRTQNDRLLFAQEWRFLLERNTMVDFWQDTCVGVEVEKESVVGVKTSMGHVIKASTVILTSGTFLNGLIHIGEKQFGGGRAGEKAVQGITEQLLSFGFESGRMKTGTPPRVDGRSLDYSKMEEQFGDEHPSKFSFFNTSPLTKQRSCYITYTNENTHEALKEGFNRSPMFNGSIKSTGPRYCPSIEDKISRFSSRDRHQIFVEPEGWKTVEMYINGFSTSLPEEVQEKALRLIPGFEKSKMFRPGYAIEYDYFPPTQLSQTLETKCIRGLFFAGQINGTTGYEEAACQGLMAGVNAFLKSKNKEPFVLSRSEAYIGVLIDDLITKGTEEPYRMFTSRAEYRILLRQDNADIRLSQLGYSLGLLSSESHEKVQIKIKETESLKKSLQKEGVDPEKANTYLEKKKSSPIKQKVRLSSLITRPNITIDDVLNMSADSKNLAGKISEEAISQTEIQLKYDGYINREESVAKKMSRLDSVKIPIDLEYKKLKNLSSEAKEKLSIIKPSTIGQASRVSGVSPSDISVLLVFMGR